MRQFGKFMHNAKMASKAIVVALLVLCLAWQAYSQTTANCTALGAGRHAVDGSSCQNYTLCVYVTANNSYVAYDYVCPTTSVFNPNSGLCTTNYTCTSTTTTTTTTTTSSVCTADGFVADPSSTNCTTYIQCVNINGTYSETTLTCPDNTFYNPNTTNCEVDYNCTTTFTCTAAGRFANPSDTTCQTYYLCVLQADGTTYAQYQYTCLTTSVFNPNSRLCTTSYTCGS